MESILNIVTEYDNFPYFDPIAPKKYHNFVDDLWHFHLPDDPRPHGYILPSIVKLMPWTSDFELDSRSIPKKVRLLKKGTNWQENCNEAIAQVLAKAREKNLFKCLRYWRNEQYRVLGANFHLRVERAGAGLFGIIHTAVHLNAYTKTADGKIKLWIPRRSVTTKNNPGMLDTSVAGGVPANLSPFECLIAEAADEAGIPESMTRGLARCTGSVLEFNIDHGKNILVPIVSWVYDMEVGEDVILKPTDTEVQEFQLIDADEVKLKIQQGAFKQACAFVLIDFLIRHSIITLENEENFSELAARLHRYLPFPTTPAKNCR